MNRLPFITVPLAAAIGVAGFARTVLADGRAGDGDYHHMWGGGGSMMFAGPFMMILFLAIAVVIVVVVVRWLQPHSGSTPRAGSNARVILDERFARGEIEAEEYRARRAELDG